MKDKALTKKIIGCAFKVHNTVVSLGPNMTTNQED